MPGHTSAAVEELVVGIVAVEELLAVGIVAVAETVVVEERLVAGIEVVADMAAVDRSVGMALAVSVAVEVAELGQFPSFRA